MRTVKYWVAGAAALVVVVAAAGWFLLISPRYSHAADLRSQAQEQEDANAALSKKVERLKQDEAKLPAQQALLATVQQRIPTDAALPSLTRQLVGAASAADVDLISINPDTAQVLQAPAAASGAQATPTPQAGATATTTAPAVPDLSAMHVQVKVNGGYFNVQQFLGKLEKLDRTVLVTAIDMAPGTPLKAPGDDAAVANSPDDTWRTIDAVIDLTVFMSPADNSVTPTGAPAPSTKVNS